MKTKKKISRLLLLSSIVVAGGIVVISGYRLLAEERPKTSPSSLPNAASPSVTEDSFQDLPEIGSQSSQDINNENKWAILSFNSDADSYEKTKPAIALLWWDADDAEVRGDRKGAERILRRAIATYPSSHQLHAKLAELLWDESESDKSGTRDPVLLRGAADEAEKAMHLSMAAGSLDRSTLWFLAQTLGRLHEKKELEHVFTEALAVDQNGELFLDFAQGLDLMGDPRAEDYFQEVVSRQKDGTGVGEYTWWLLDHERNQDALTLLTAIMEQSAYFNSIDDFHLLRGVALERLGRLDEAAAEYREHHARGELPEKFKIPASKVQKDNGITLVTPPSNRAALPNTKSALSDNDAITGLAFLLKHDYANMNTGEAPNESIGGQRAEAWTVRNRVLRGQVGPDTDRCLNDTTGNANTLSGKYREVICAPKQYKGKCTAWCNDPSTNSCGNKNSPVRQVAQDVYDGHAPDPVGQHCPGGITTWGNDFCDSATTCAGDLTTYRLKGALFNLGAASAATCPSPPFSCLSPDGPTCSNKGIENCFYSNITYGSASNPFSYPSSLTTNSRSYITNTISTVRAGEFFGHLEGPETTAHEDFNLSLERLSQQCDWKVVDSSARPASVEDIDFHGDAGTYRWKVSAASGSGAFQLETQRRPDRASVSSLGRVQQFSDDGRSPIPFGASTITNTVRFQATVTAAPPSKRARLEIELRRVDECGGEFSGNATQASELVNSGRVAEARADSLIQGAYHWRARLLDESGHLSDWISSGNSGSTDFRIVTTSCTTSATDRSLATGISCPPLVSVSLTASPSNGPAPLAGVTLQANVTGAPNEAINYTFYCNRSDAGVDIRPGWDKKYDGLLRTQVRVPGLCNYGSAGTHMAKIIAEQGNSAAESRVPITVGSSVSCFPLTLAENDPRGGNVPTPSPTESSGCASGQYRAGEFVQVSAAAAPGWSIGSWSGTQADASTLSKNSLIMPAADHTVIVNYVQLNATGYPAVSGEDADGITASSATLHAFVNADGLPTDVFFEYGTGVPTAFTSTLPQSIGGGSQPVPVSFPVVGLGCGSTYTHHAVATNSAGTTPGPFQAFMTSPCGSALAVVTASLPDAASDHPYSAQLTATGGTGSGYVWSLTDGNLPFGLTLNPQTGVISGTPAGFGAASNFTVGLGDSGGHFTYRSLSIFVGRGLAIYSDSPSEVVFAVNTLYGRSNSVIYLASGGQPPYSWQATGLPPGLQMDAAGGFLYGTPTQLGSFPAEITVTDALSATTSRSWSLSVAAATLIITDTSGHRPPTPPPATLGASYQFFFAAQGGSQIGYTWSVQGALPPGLTAQNGPNCPTYCSLLISGTPTQAGSFSFTVGVRDQFGNTASQGAAIVVNSGQPPMINTMRLPKATIGLPYTTSLSASGGTPGYQWEFVGNSPDPGLQLSAAGVLSGTPTLTNDCPSGATDGGDVWVGPNYPTRYFSVKVTDAAGQATTMGLCLVSYHPTPHLSAASPSFVVADGQNHTITVEGSNFRSDSSLSIGLALSPVPTNYVSPNTITLTLYPALGGPFSTSPGGGALAENTQPLRVIQPYATFDNSIDFNIFDPPPTVSNVSAVITNSNRPCTPNLLCQLVVNGGGLVYSTSYLVVEVNQSLGRVVTPSTPIPWTQVTTSAFSVSSAGTYTLRVTNGHQVNGQSASVDIPFSVQP